MHNQTEERWLIGVSEMDIGTALYLADAGFLPKNNILNGRHTIRLVSGLRKLYEKFLITQITYTDAVEIGNEKAEIHVLKWFPPNVATPTELETAAPCDGSIICVDRCARASCACKNGRCC
jgi:hypothetical protein